MRALMAGLVIAFPLSAEAVSYSFIFDRSYESVLNVQPASGPSGSLPPYVASAEKGGGFVPTFMFGFAFDGSLDGLTLDIANLGMDETWATGFDESWGNANGFVTFTGNQITDWDISASTLSSGYRNTSAPITVDPAGWLWPDFIDQSMIPAAHYGLNHWEPAIFSFALAQGRWSCLADDVPCVDTTLVVTPVPASLLLLLSAVGMTAAVRLRKSGGA